MVFLIALHSPETHDDANNDGKIEVNVRCKDKKKPLPRYICGKAAIFEEKINVS